MKLEVNHDREAKACPLYVPRIDVPFLPSRTQQVSRLHTKYIAGTVDRRITPPTAAPDRSVQVSLHSAPQYSDAEHAYLPGDTHPFPGFSRHGNVHVGLAD